MVCLRVYTENDHLIVYISSDASRLPIFFFFFLTIFQVLFPLIEEKLCALFLFGAFGIIEKFGKVPKR